MGHRVGVIPLGGMEVFEVVPWVYGGTARGILGYGSFTLVGVSAIAVIPWVSEATFRGVPVLESSSVGGGGFPKCGFMGASNHIGRGSLQGWGTSLRWVQFLDVVLLVSGGMSSGAPGQGSSLS